jgi:periplasmic divalent cation tolerance protein
MAPVAQPDFVVVLMTAPREVAEALARQLVSARLVACVNLVPGVVSVFAWEGRVDRAEEVLLVAKTSGARLDGLREALRARHPYAVPELLVLPIVDGLPAYLAWLGDAIADGPALSDAGEPGSGKTPQAGA